MEVRILETLKVHVKDIDLLKSLFSVIITAFEDGASFSIVDREKVIFLSNTNLKNFNPRLEIRLPPADLQKEFLNPQGVKRQF